MQKLFCLMVVLILSFVNISQNVLAAGSTAQQLEQFQQALATITATVKSSEIDMKDFIDADCKSVAGYAKYKDICDESKKNLLVINTKLKQNLTALQSACANLSAEDRANFCKDNNTYQAIIDNIQKGMDGIGKSGTTTNPTPPPTSTTSGGLVPCGVGNNPPCTLCHLVIGIKGIIDWGMSVMTFFAIAIIVAMAIVYIVSAGNSGMMTTAKNGLKSTLIGFVLMLGAWVIINFFMITLAKPDLGIKATNWYTFTCDTTSTTNQINQTNPPPGPGGNLTCTTGKCATNAQVVAAVKNNASGLNPNVQMAIIDAGEGCNKNESPAHACGYSQVMPEYRRTVCGLQGTNAETCAAVQNNLQLDINCGAKFIKTDSAYVKCYNEGGIRLLAACYNRGRAAALKGDCGEGTPPYCQRVETYYNSCPK